MPQRDWSGAEIPELIEDLVTVHHRQLRGGLERVGALIRQLSLRHDELQHLHLEQACTHFSDNLLSYLTYEEYAIFPLCIAIESASRGRGRCTCTTNDVTTRIRVMMHGHEDVAAEAEQLLKRVEMAMGLVIDADLPAIRCGVIALQADLAAHFHMEKDILVPAALFAEEQVEARRQRYRDASTR